MASGIIPSAHAPRRAATTTTAAIAAAIVLAGVPACSPPSPPPTGPRVAAMAQAACSELAEVMGVYRFAHVVRGSASVPHPRTGAPVPACQVTEPEAEVGSEPLLDQLTHDMTVRGWETQPEIAPAGGVALRRSGALCRVTSGASSSPGHTRLEAVCMAETPA